MDERQNEGSNGRTGGIRNWPDDIDSGVLVQFASYYWDLKRSLNAAAFSWDKAGTDEKAAYLEQLAQLRKKEQRVFAKYLSKPITKNKE